MESADRESRRLDILSVKKEANLSAREVGEVEVYIRSLRCTLRAGIVTHKSSLTSIGRFPVNSPNSPKPKTWHRISRLSTNFRRPLAPKLLMGPKKFCDIK